MKEVKNNQLDTEQTIFDAAQEVFTQKGYDGAKMQEIADKAGINKALLHYYFRSKDKLFHSVAKLVLKRFLPVIRNIIEADIPLEEKIDNFVEHYVNVIRKNTFIPLFLITEMNRHPKTFFEQILEEDAPKPQFFFKQVQEAMDEGRIIAMEPEHLLVNIISLCIFPFLGKPILQLVLGFNEKESNYFYDQRKEHIKVFIKNALRPV